MGPRTLNMIIFALDMLEKSLRREMKAKRDARRSIQADGILSELDDLQAARRIVAAIPVDLSKEESIPSQPLSPSTVKNK